MSWGDLGNQEVEVSGGDLGHQEMSGGDLSHQEMEVSGALTGDLSHLAQVAHEDQQQKNSLGNTCMLQYAIQ